MKNKSSKTKSKNVSDIVQLGKSSFRLKELEMGRFLIEREGKSTPKTAQEHGNWSLKKMIVLEGINKTVLTEKLAKIGILSPATLATFALKKEDPTPFASFLGLPKEQVVGLWHHALSYLSQDERRSLEREASKENATGALIEGTPEYKRFFAEHNLGAINKIQARDFKLSTWVPPLHYEAKAIDYRSYLGVARDQNPRGSCYTFAATAVREFNENIRAGRGEKIDLSEEYIFWYSKKGQRLTAGGGDGIATLKEFSQSGACKENYWPYLQKNIPSNHAHVPAPTEAIDNAVFYKGGDVVYLTPRDVDEIKIALRKGKIVVIHTGTYGWNPGTGEIRLPFPGENFGTGGHAVAVIGFVDSDSVPDEWGGGYLIIRNSWGDQYGLNNVMGPEYGGHLRMPYAYYNQYTSGAGTYADDDTVYANKWIAEYYTNKYLEGTPWLIKIVNQISFEWGYNGPITDWFKDIFGGWFGGLKEDKFSARWSTVRFLRGGWYWFNTISDDGIRVWVDDRLIINEWNDHSPTQVQKDIYIPDGMHVIKVEYYENAGNATAKFSFAPKSWNFKIFANNTANGEHTYYYNNSDLAAEWRHLPPVNANNDQFSVTAEGKINFNENEEVIFHALASGGIKVYLDGSLVINSWNSKQGVYKSNPVNITAGEHQIKVAFRNRETVPTPGENRIFHSFFQVNWYNTKWDVKIYHDLERKSLSGCVPQNQLADYQYQLMQGRGLSGLPLGHIKPDKLCFPNSEAIKDAFGGDDTFPLDWISIIANKKIVSQGQRHRFRINADDGFRFCVDGRCLLDNQHIIGSDNYDVEVDLSPGVHDLSVEYYQSKWGSRLEFSDRSSNIWTAKWYNNRDLSGTPTSTTQVDKIDFDWGSNGPGISGIGKDNFSVQFSTSLYLRRGKYRFVARSNDGVRLYVDGKIVIDSWYDRGARTDTVELDIIGGLTKIILEYYEHGGTAKVSFDYFPIGFLGEYYKGRNLGKDENNKQIEPPYMYRYDPSINFDWSSGSPNPRFNRDNYSVRWSGMIELPVGRYKVKTTTDDGVRLLIDGKIAIESWKDSSAKLLHRLVDLVGRYHDVVLEYYENKGVAECRLEFERIVSKNVSKSIHILVDAMKKE